MLHKDKFHDAAIDPRRSNSPSQMVRQTWNELIEEQKQLLRRFENTSKRHQLERRSLEVKFDTERDELMAKLQKGMDTLNELFQSVAYRQRELTRRSLLSQHSAFKPTQIIPTPELQLDDTIQVVRKGASQDIQNNDDTHQLIKPKATWCCFIV